MTNSKPAGQGLRYLTVIRLSDFKDASTSPERQRDHCRTAIRLRDGVEAGVAEDLDVSATKFSPFERPQLGQWLSDPVKVAQWDVLVVWRLDRLIRSTRDLAELLAWCDANGKLLVSATEGFDLGTPFGRAMVAIIAALAQLEAETVKLRVEDSHAKLRTMDRWASGSAPLGFKVIPHPSGKGKGLATDPDARDLLYAMAGKLLEGWSLTSIAEWCTETDQLSARDRARIAQGQEPNRRSPWSVASLRRVLESPVLQGWKCTREAERKGGQKLVLDSEGQPIRMAPPTFDDATWEQIQAALAARTTNGKRRTHSPNPMLGIGICGVCGSTAAQHYSKGRPDKDGNRKVYREYRCGRSPKPCRQLSHRADDVDANVEAAFLASYGDQKVRERVFVPGTDNRADIEQTKASMVRLKAESDLGLVTDDAEYYGRLGALKSRLGALEENPYQPSHWEYRETGITYGEAWQGADAERRRALLVSAEVIVVLHRDKLADIEVDRLRLTAGPGDATGDREPMPEGVTADRCQAWMDHEWHTYVVFGESGVSDLQYCPGGPRTVGPDGLPISDGLRRRLYGDN